MGEREPGKSSGYLGELLVGRDIVSGGGAGEAEVVAAERVIGRFPLDYRRFLLEYGWLQVDHNEIYGVGAGVPPYLDVVRMTLAERTEPAVPLPGGWICVLNDGAGNLVSFDSDSVSETAPIFLWDHEREAAEFLAPSFTEWLRELLSE